MCGKSKFAGYILVCLFVAVITAEADRLEPVLRARDVQGVVTVQLAGQADFEPLEEGRTYPYGSRFRTDFESAVRLAMSAENSVLVLPATEIVFAEGRQNPRIKTVRLIEGEVEAQLGPNFGEAGNVLNIAAANAIAQAVGTRYRVASKFEKDFQMVVIRVLEGIVRILGENFEVAEIRADQQVSLVSPPDRSFVRLRNMRGRFDVTVKDETDKDDADGNRQLPTEEGTVLKIWQSIVAETGERVVSVVFMNPEGEMLETISMTFAPNEHADFITGGKDDEDEYPWEQFVIPVAPADGTGQPPAQPRERDEPQERDNPMPPDEFLDELVERMLEGLMPGVGRRPRQPFTPTPAPRPPVRPTPTPVGNL